MSGSDAEIGAYFDACAANGMMGEFSPEEIRHIEVWELGWHIQHGDRVLEPGCGSGRLSARLAPLVGPRGEVLAFDLSTAMIERARRRTLGTQLQFETASAASIPAPDEHFHHAICLNVLPHIQQPVGALRELARVMVAGGHLWIHHFGSRAEVNAFHRGLGGVVGQHRIPPAGEVESLLTVAGFDIHEIGDTPNGYRVHATRV